MQRDGPVTAGRSASSPSGWGWGGGSGSTHGQPASTDDVERRVQARAQLLRGGRGGAIPRSDEEDLGRRVLPQLVGDALDDVLVADPGGGVDAGPGQGGEAEDEVALSPLPAGSHVGGPAVEEAVVGGGDAAPLGLRLGWVDGG